MDWDRSECAECGKPVAAWCDWNYERRWLKILVVEPCETCIKKGAERKLLTFTEAMAAAVEGKVIRSCVSGKTWKVFEDQIHLLTANGWILRDRFTVDTDEMLWEWRVVEDPEDGEIAKAAPVRRLTEDEVLEEVKRRRTGD